MDNMANCALGQYMANEVVILCSCININDKKYVVLIIEGIVKTTNIKKSMYFYNTCIKFAVVQS